MRARYLAVSALTSFLVACGGGGGGGSAGTTPTPPQNCGSSSSNSCASVALQAGDFFTYSRTDTATTPSGILPVSTTFTAYDASLNSDGTFTRYVTFSDPTAPGINYTLGSNALESRGSSSQGACTRSPAANSQPPHPTYVGQAWSTAYAQTCQATGSSSTLTTNVQVTGQVAAAESLSVTAGTFNTLKSTKTITAQNSTGIDTITSTCWVDIRTAREVRCTGTDSFVPAGQTTASSVVNYQYDLIGYSFHGGAMTGSGIARFTGTWAIAFNGVGMLNCSINIDMNGNASGSCNDAFRESYAGTVTANGVLNMNILSGGNAGTITGNLGSPVSGSGTVTFTPSTLSGTWAAAHQ